LAALEEAAAQAQAGPIQRSKALAFSLAYLWAYSGGDRWPFDGFWRDLADPYDIGRTQSLNANLNAIHARLGIASFPSTPGRGWNSTADRPENAANGRTNAQQDAGNGQANGQ
jgi:hypothetical protein